MRKKPKNGELCYGFYGSKLMDLPKPKNVCIAEYIWIDEIGVQLRSKARTLHFFPERLEEIPEWDCDGWSNCRDDDALGEVRLRPVAMFKDPFRLDGENNILVLCEAFIWSDMTRPQKVFTERVPNFSNFR